ncbi:hypothetical protein STEG23_036581 [Scotinomys teguina]
MCYSCKPHPSMPIVPHPEHGSSAAARGTLCALRQRHVRVSYVRVNYAVSVQCFIVGWQLGLGTPPTEATMARITAIMRKIQEYVRTEEFRDYITSTYFWGPVVNWGLLMAASKDMKEPPDIISGCTTVALIFYSMAFMRFIYRIQPQNYLLMMCHFSNMLAQSLQASRYLKYYYSGRAKASNSAAE